MTRSIGIRLLTQHEVAEMIGEPRFNALHPVGCGSCNNTHDFTRRVFRIQGVPKAEENADSTQEIIAHHLKESHHVGSVFFKTFAGEFYVDSAVCGKCGSTMVVFDIDLSDDLLARVSRLTGMPIEQVRAEMETLGERIAEDERKSEPDDAANGSPPFRSE
jgi:hypothetical protein